MGRVTGKMMIGERIPRGMKRMSENILPSLSLRYLPRFPPLTSETTTTTTTTNEEDDSRIIRAMSKQGNGHVLYRRVP